ncbi:hypothetical protein ACWEN3_31785 [Streptomyces sp. NPDC004561]
MDQRPLRGPPFPGPAVLPPAFDRPVPADLLPRLTYRSRRGERQIKHVVDGELRSPVSIQGVYRPAPDSAREPTERIAGGPASH